MMTTTALRANTEQGQSPKEVTRTITFKNDEHENFYNEYLQKCRYQDAYHQALGTSSKV